MEFDLSRSNRVENTLRRHNKTRKNNSVQGHNDISLLDQRIT
jgi:hypothetical protein